MSLPQPQVSAPASPGVFCAVHAERSAATLCNRCGNYACEDCFRVAHDRQDYCLSCLPRIQPALAERGARFTANLVDHALVLGPGFVCGLLGGLLAVSKDSSAGVSAALLLVIAGTLAAIGAICWQLYVLSTTGQSVGKRMMGIKVVRTDGGQVDLARLIFLRNVLPSVIDLPVSGLFALIDKLFIFGAPRRCLHDYLADTRVIVVPKPE